MSASDFSHKKIWMSWIMDEGIQDKFQRLLNNQLLPLINVILAVEKI